MALSCTELTLKLKHQGYIKHCENLFYKPGIRSHSLSCVIDITKMLESERKFYMCYLLLVEILLIETGSVLILILKKISIFPKFCPHLGFCRKNSYKNAILIVFLIWFQTLFKHIFLTSQCKINPIIGMSLFTLIDMQKCLKIICLIRIKFHFYLPIHTNWLIGTFKVVCPACSNIFSPQAR